MSYHLVCIVHSLFLHLLTINIIASEILVLPRLSLLTLLKNTLF